MFRLRHFMEGAAAPESEPQKFSLPEPDDVISVDELELERLRGDRDEEDPEAAADGGQAGEAGADAGKAGSPERFAIFPGGVKVPLNEKGELTDEAVQKALHGKYVPESVFHSEIAKAKQSAAPKPPAQAPAAPAPAAKAASDLKAPEPFKRADNPHDKEDDRVDWIEFEREQDKLERKHEREQDRYDHDMQLASITASITENKVARDVKEREEQFETEFNTAMTSVKTSKGAAIPPADSPARQNLHDFLWNQVSLDPRNRFIPKSEQFRQYEVATEQILSEYWELLHDWKDHEVGLLTGTVKKAAGKAVSSPHKGGAPSMAATAGGEARQVRPTQRPLKEGETAAQNIMSTLVKGGRAPK
jgi:hypothetical protein